MGFKVEGALDGVLYDVEVTGDEQSPIVGNPRVRALLQQWVGRSVEVTPQGPVLTVAAGDPRSVLALLSSQTTVRKVGPGAPQLLPPPQAGAVD
jgi:hypothetical protein